MCLSHYVLVSQRCHHDDYPDVLLPHHPPEVSHGVMHRSLGADEVPLWSSALHHRHTHTHTQSVTGAGRWRDRQAVQQEQLDTELLQAQNLRWCSRCVGWRFEPTASRDSGHLQPDVVRKWKADTLKSHVATHTHAHTHTHTVAVISSSVMGGVLTGQYVGVSVLLSVGLRVSRPGREVFANFI